jgi:altronate dehydratase large subunit
MDTPGLDVEAVTGMVGGGAQVVLFTTGLGTPTGNPVAPVVKITGNSRTAAMTAVCSGRPTAAERLGHREFAIHRRNPTF